ncbi:MAG: hypothetical protein IPK13_26490 [Deltaproteobacteria bacterium]|nr:hypothetical protein [Deltaproteobacteria bacterium]
MLARVRRLPVGGTFAAAFAVTAAVAVALGSAPRSLRAAPSSTVSLSAGTVSSTASATGNGVADVDPEVLGPGEDGMPVAPMPETAAPAMVSPSGPGGGQPSEADAPRGDVTAATRGGAVEWVGYIRILAEAVENDAASTFVGRNDGFRLASARLGARVRYGALYGYVSIDGAVGEREGFNASNATLALEPRDVQLGYEFAQYASLTLGRFRAPYDLGEVVDTELRTFIDAPLESRGVEATLGYQMKGLSQGRQLGVMLHRERVGLSEDGFDVGYALALTNGRTEGLAFNDNDRLAGFARATVHYGSFVSLNVAGFTDTRTVGELPNLFDERVRGFEGSLSAEAFGLAFEGQILFQRTDFLTSGRPKVDALGLHAQCAYRFGNWLFAYRYAWLDPNTTNVEGEASERDAVSEHTLGVVYWPIADGPLKFAMNGTIAKESPGRRLDNNRITLLSQILF